MPLHDFRCSKCGHLWEVYQSIETMRRELACACGGIAVLTWLKAPGLGGVEGGNGRGVTTTFKPGYDVQLGKTFTSLNQRNKYLKTRGLVPVGPDEFKRNQNGPTLQDREPDYRNLPAVMKDAWENVKADEAKGKQPDPLPILDLKKNSVMISQGEK